MNTWLQKLAYEDRFISPEEAGYKPEWGEHHGGNTIKLDTWNYGPKGYMYPPMPLPKKLYHATPFPDRIMAEGFIVPKKLKMKTFGGSDDFSSFTSLENAKRYLFVIQDLIRLANGEFDHMGTEEALDFLIQRYHGDPEQTVWLKKMILSWENYDREQGKENKRKSILQFFGHAHNSGVDMPWIFGADLKHLEPLKGLKPEDAGIVEVETVPMQWHSGTNIWHDTDMSQNYTYNTHENEWRVFNPEQNLRPIRILR